MELNRLGNRFTSSAGEVAYGSDGEGSADLIFVHGTPSNSIVWRPVIGHLKDDFRLHYLDLPGYGASAKFDGQDVRLRTFARVLREFIEHIGIEHPHLVGHDFGAATVLGATLVEHVRPASITVADGVVLNPWGTPYSLHVKNHEDVFRAVPEYIHRATLRAHLETAVHRAMDPAIEDELIDSWLGQDGQAAYYRQVAQYDHGYTEKLEGLYPTLDIPILVLWGEKDQWVDISVGRRLHELVPGSRFETLPDAGHFSMIDCPGLFARYLRQWLSYVKDRQQRARSV